MTKVLITGAAGFIGSHLVRYLKKLGYWVRGVDVKRPEWDVGHEADEFEILDLRRWDACLQAMRGGIEEVYALAADMGGMGFIANHHAEILHNNALINIHTAEAARLSGVKRIFFSSSACIYNEDKQTKIDAFPLQEKDAYPANPQDEYGWEKLYSERVYLRYAKEYGFESRVARFHNVMGSRGTWEGGREKAPAAICRKVAEAKLSSKKEVGVWGDGKATRTFMHIDDCVEGIYRIMMSNYREPLNLGRDEVISVDGLVELVSDIAKWPVTIKHIDGPEGVRGRSSDNSRLREVLGWESKIDLREGLTEVYQWVEEQVWRKMHTKEKVFSPPGSLHFRSEKVLVDNSLGGISCRDPRLIPDAFTPGSLGGGIKWPSKEEQEAYEKQSVNSRSDKMFNTDTDTPVVLFKTEKFVTCNYEMPKTSVLGAPEIDDHHRGNKK